MLKRISFNFVKAANKRHKVVISIAQYIGDISVIITISHITCHVNILSIQEALHTFASC